MRISVSLMALPLAVLLLSAVPAAMAGSTWTVLMYMVADDDDAADIEDAVIRDLDGISASGPPEGVTVLAQVDRGKKLSRLMRERYEDPDYSGVVRYRIERGTWKVLGKPGELNSGDAQVFLDFVDWGMAQAPADRYLLVISSHGSGTMSWRGVGAVGSARPGEVILRGSSYVGYDDANNDCLTLFEMAKVLETVREKRGRPIEVVALDACLAGAVEALFHLRDSCEVLVAPASTISMTGFDYAGILAALRRDPSIQPEALAEVLVKTSIDALESGDLVLGAFRTRGVEDLVGAVDRLAMELIRAHKQAGALRLSNLASYGGKKLYWDLKRIAERVADPATDLRGATNATQLREAAADVLAARKALTVSLWYMGDLADAKVGGLSIYWPDAADYKKHRSFYKVLAHSVATHWDEFVDLRELGIE